MRLDGTRKELGMELNSDHPVAYTRLDVYKRQFHSIRPRKDGPRLRCTGRTLTPYRHWHRFGIRSGVVFESIPAKIFQQFDLLSVEVMNFTIPVIAS